MPAPSPLARFIGPLEQLGLPHCITGTVAASVYGEPRLTADIDVVLLLRRADLEALTWAFPGDENYVPPVETLLRELGRETHGMFNLIHHGTQFKADIFLASTCPLSRLKYRDCNCRPSGCNANHACSTTRADARRVAFPDRRSARQPHRALARRRRRIIGCDRLPQWPTLMTKGGSWSSQYLSQGSE